MTTMEWIAKNRARLAKIKAGEPLQKAAQEAHRVMGNRIFNDGLAATGAPIGQYNSTHPIYVNPNKSPVKFAPAGKPGANTNIKNRKSKYFSSYKDFRSAAGRDTSKVNLALFGRLRSDYLASLRKVQDNLWESKLKEVNNALKARGAEQHFGKLIFSLSKLEKELFLKVITAETSKILNA